MLALITLAASFCFIPILIMVSLNKYPRLCKWCTRLGYLLNLLSLFPCIYLSFTKIIQRDPLNWIWSRSFLGATFPIIILNLFFLPYIFSVLWICAYVFYLKKSKFPKFESAFFILTLILCIMGLCSINTVFRAGMGI